MSEADPRRLFEAFRAASSAHERHRLLDQLDHLGHLDQAPPAWRTALTLLLAGPEPDQALIRAAALPASVIERAFWPTLVTLLHQGSYPARLIELWPPAADVLDPAQAAVCPSVEQLTADIQARTRDTDIGQAIAEIRTREYLRIARQEVEDAPLEVVGAALSRLATACVRAATRALALDDSVVVFGMGKLGGDELNFLSDIDLVFVHDDGVDEAVGPLHERLRLLVRALEGPARFRPVFRVDLRLRPFGARGPLSMSLGACESYYERHGRPWERQVWLRAQALAGRFDLGQRLLERLTPFVYRRAVTAAIFDEVSELMLRARREARQSEHVAVDVKLDAGGIREVEFFVQALQLLHGGRIPALRERNTLCALDRLAATGIIVDREHRELTDAYRFLRRTEHRLQLAEGQQTHAIPEEIGARRLLASRLAWNPMLGSRHDLAGIGRERAGLTVTSSVAVSEGDGALELPHGRDDREDGDTQGDHDHALVAFEAALTFHRQHVMRIAQTLHGPSSDEAVTLLDYTLERARRIIVDHGAPKSTVLQALQHFGLRDAEEAHALLQHLYSREEGAFTASGESRTGAENLLLACLESADPDAALHRLVEFAAVRPAHDGLWRHFATRTPEANASVSLVAELLGSSDELSRGLIHVAHAGNRARSVIVDVLLDSRALELPGTAQMQQHFGATLLDRDEEPLPRRLARFKALELVRIALADLGRRPDPLEVGRSLSDLADVIMQQLTNDLARRHAAGKTRASADACFDLHVLALGKYGMQAMDYASDLDLMFVFVPPSHTPPQRALELQRDVITLAQQLISTLQDRSYGSRLYEVDMRLRPSGRQGLLVSSLAAFTHYHAQALPVWERLAMLRVRPVSRVRIGNGSPAESALAAAMPASSEHGSEQAEQIMQIITDSLFAPNEANVQQFANIGLEVRKLKQRIESELARESRGKYNAKTGHGGCLELELLVAALQLRHGQNVPALRVRGIAEALMALASHHVLAQQEANDLLVAYRFQRLFLNRLRMLQGIGSDEPERFAANSPRLVTLARRMGLPDSETLLQRYLEHRERVRHAFDRHLN